MIEVFKTNVNQETHARMLVHQIGMILGYEATFDLSDCDRILRVQGKEECVSAPSLINLLKDFGFHAEVLPEEDPAVGGANR